MALPFSTDQFAVAADVEAAGVGVALDPNRVTAVDLAATVRLAHRSPLGHSTGRPRVPHVVGEIVINRPVEQVFDFVADERNEPQFNPKMLTVEKVTPGPVGKGTRFRTQVKARRRTAEMSVQFTAYSPDRGGLRQSASCRIWRSRGR